MLVLVLVLDSFFLSITITSTSGKAKRADLLRESAPSQPHIFWLSKVRARSRSF